MLCKIQHIFFIELSKSLIQQQTKLRFVMFVNNNFAQGALKVLQDKVYIFLLLAHLRTKANSLFLSDYSPEARILD